MIVFYYETENSFKRLKQLSTVVAINSCVRISFKQPLSARFTNEKRVFDDIN